MTHAMFPTVLIVRRLLCLLLVTLAVATVACQPQQREETVLFQEAEALYRGGDYDGAARRYQAFLVAYPRSPFSKTAKLRLRTIDREVESVMGVRGGNRPIYIKPEDQQPRPDVGTPK
jgi:hypothetical protein